jgi:actin-related protein 6
MLKSAGASLTRTLDDAVKGFIKAGWPVENVSFSLAVVSMHQNDPGVPIWEYHHRAEKNERGVKNVTRDSQYLVGSVSKVISDYILLKSGVDIDRPVTDFIPKLNSSKSKVHWKDITLRMLASQLSGAPTNSQYSARGVILSRANGLDRRILGILFLEGSLCAVWISETSGL